MEDQGIYEPLRWMFEEAWAKGLWFFSDYQRLWLSPDELEKANRKGRLWWGPVNWVLRDPGERIVELMRERQENLKEIESIHRKILLIKQRGKGNG